MKKILFLSRRLRTVVDEDLGVELIQNADFSNGTTSWYSPQSPNLNAIDGRGRTTTIYGSAWWICQAVSGLIIGATYKLTGKITRGTATGDILLRFSTQYNLSSGTLKIYSNPNDGTFTLTIVAEATTMYLGCVHAGASSGLYYEISNFSLKQKNASKLIINGDFASGETSPWYSPSSTGDLQIVNGRCRTICSTETYWLAQKLENLEVGASYRFTGNIYRGTSVNTIFLRLSTGSSLTGATLVQYFSPDEGAFDVIVTPTATTMYAGIIIGNETAGNYCEVDDWSLEKIIT